MFNPPGVTGFGDPESPEGIPIDVPEEGDPDFIGPVQPDEPDLELPPDFVGGGPSFEGGTIFETPLEPFEITESTTLSDIIEEFGVSASAAANIKFETLEFPTSTFDFGTNTNVEGA